MSEEFKNEKRNDSEPPFPKEMSTADFIQAMDEIRTLHKKQTQERHAANSAQQKAVGILSLEQIKISDRMAILAETILTQEHRMGSLEKKLDVVLVLAEKNVTTGEVAADKAETAAKTGGKTLVEQRVAIAGALGTVLVYLIDHFTRH
jgi:hypothetical protein